MTARHTVPLSCTSFSFPLLPLADVIRLVAMLQLPAIDLCIADGEREVRTRDVLADPAGLAAVHRAWCEQAELHVADVFAHLGTGPADRPINTADPQLSRDNRDRLAQYLVYARSVGSPGLTLSAGQAGDAGAFERSVRELTHLVIRAGDAGLRIGVEPHLGSVASTVDEAIRLCDAVPGLALTLDYSHFIAAGIPQETVHPLFAYARHAHIRQSAPGNLQCPVSDGVLDVHEMLDQAARAGYSGSFTLEYVHSPMWSMNRLDVLSETVRLRDLIRSGR